MYTIVIIFRNLFERQQEIHDCSLKIAIFNAHFYTAFNARHESSEILIKSKQREQVATILSK